MDQDAFRVMLASGSKGPQRLTVSVNDYKLKNKPKEVEASAPAFKPRTHKNIDNHVADKPGERRPVNPMNEDGEEDTMPAPTKGLDFALLEMERSKLYQSQDADDEMLLEEAFQEVAKPKKRTREEIVAELKKARAGASAADSGLESAKQTGKFKPIGAPPEAKLKKRKVKGEEGEKKKKKRKLEAAQESLDRMRGIAEPSMPEATIDSPPELKPKTRTPSPEIDPDADIFAGAEEYRGISSDSDSGDDLPTAKNEAHKDNEQLSAVTGSLRKNWFGEIIEEEAASAPAKPAQPIEEEQVEEQEPEDIPKVEPIRRLQGLVSSIVPSIREILEIDQAAEREEKKKARKEKRNKKKNPSEETKINREVKQLESYVASKTK